MDAAVFEVLIAAALVALFLRRKKAIPFLKASGPVLLYLLYCMISTVWSPIHGPAFKRWIKDAGDLAMVLLIVTEAQPIAALGRFFSRVGFILLPFSVETIRWSTVGRGFDDDGTPSNVGLTENKNSLGLIVFLVSLGVLWNIRGLLMDKSAPNRKRRLVAQCTLLAFGIWLLQMAHCATAIACFVFGAALMLLTSLRAIRNKPRKVHALCLSIILFGGIFLLFGGESAVTGMLGRQSNLTGRTGIWKASLAAADSPILGTGFESFWNTNVEKVALRLPDYDAKTIHNLVSAHNGYIEVYLDLGLVGLCLITVILISGYRNAVKSFRYSSQLGSLLLAYVATGIFYSITEVGFRVLTPSWIFLLLAMVSANGVASGLIAGGKSRIPASRMKAASKMSPFDEEIPQPHGAMVLCAESRGPLATGLLRAKMENA
jgi:O-antigen ligase